MAYGDRTLTRSPSKGPKDGTYAILSVSLDEPTVAATSHPGNGTISLALVAPFACRAMEASVWADDITVVGSLSWKIVNVTQTLDIVASNSHPADDTAETVPGASLTNRDIAKGDVIRFDWVGTNAGDVVIRGTMQLTVWIRDHVVALEAND